MLIYGAVLRIKGDSGVQILDVNYYTKFAVNQMKKGSSLNQYSHSITTDKTSLERMSEVLLSYFIRNTRYKKM